MRFPGLRICGLPGHPRNPADRRDEVRRAGAGSGSRRVGTSAPRGRARRAQRSPVWTVAGAPARWTALLAIATWLVAPAASRSDEIEGVSFPVQLEREGGAWQLHGVGLLRYKLLVKGYVAALYTRSELASDEILGDVPRRLEIAYFWSIDATDFARATEEGIARNVDPATLEKLRPEIDQMNALYEDVAPGDRYTLTYLPGEGTELALNGRSVGRVAGAEFSSALFGIWLGDDPLSEDLRDQLLDRR